MGPFDTDDLNLVQPGNLKFSRDASASAGTGRWYSRPSSNPASALRVAGAKLPAPRRMPARREPWPVHTCLGYESQSVTS